MTVTDATDDSATVFVGPSRPARVTSHRVTTNHQEQVDCAGARDSIPQCWSRWTRLERAVKADEDVVDVMLRPPMRADRFADGFVTLYTTVRPAPSRWLITGPAELGPAARWLVDPAISVDLAAIPTAARYRHMGRASASQMLLLAGSGVLYVPQRGAVK